MAAFEISYDLVQPGRDYTRLFQAIKAYPNWAHVLESVWIVQSNGSASAIRDDLKGHIDSNDKLLVTRLQGDWASWNLGKERNDWLQSSVSGVSTY